ncbi:hypothetical protein PG984_000057 [Apiospora sp. TS-2023a]
MNRIAAFLFLAIGPQLIASRVIHARQAVVVQCDFETSANNGDSCSSFEAAWGLTPDAFAAINPGVSCPGDLISGQNYCVIGTVTSGPLVTTTSTARAPTITTAQPTRTTSVPATTTAPSSAHEPTQSGLVANCNNFHLVGSGDSCSVIESRYGIGAADFASWNPFIDSTCSNLWLNYRVCVGVPGAATSANPVPTTTAPSTPAPSSPSPQMPDITSGCDKFHQVQSGDSCWSIEQAAGISSAQFLAWNHAVDAACDNMWLDYYVCVGVSSGPPTEQPTTTTKPVPSPPRHRPGRSGDGCWSIEQSNGITLAQFLAWNPAVDAACSDLWLGYYVCVG